MIVLFVLALLLIMLLILAIPRAKAKAVRVQCINNLAHVGLGIRIFASENDHLLPWETNASKFTNFQGNDEILKYILTTTNEISTPAILLCPADTRKRVQNWSLFTRQNMSYFLNPDTAESFPNMILLGDRNLITNGIPLGPGRVKIDPKNNPPAWDATQHHFQGNAVMGDGSIQQLSSRRLSEVLTNSSQNQTTFLFP